MESIAKAKVVKDEFKRVGQAIPQVKPGTNARSERRFQIGSEAEGNSLCISISKQQLALCFNQTKDHELETDRIFNLARDVAILLEGKAVYEGFLHRGIGILDELDEDFLAAVQRKFLREAALDQFSEISFKQNITVNDYPCRLKYSYEGVKLRKSKRDILKLDYSLLTKPDKNGMEYATLIGILENLAGQDYFSKMLKRLPDAKSK